MKTHLAMHVAEHCGIKPYKCMRCKKEFVQKHNLTRHEKENCKPEVGVVDTEQGMTAYE